jgi:hypothetical protein
MAAYTSLADARHSPPTLDPIVNERTPLNGDGDIEWTIELKRANRLRKTFMLRLIVLSMLFGCIILEITAPEHTPLLLWLSFYTILVFLWNLLVVIISGNLRRLLRGNWESGKCPQSCFRHVTPLNDTTLSAFLIMATFWAQAWPNATLNLHNSVNFQLIFALHCGVW